MMKIIKPRDLQNNLLPGAVVIDVRSDIEHRELCLSCAHDHVPLDRLDPSSYLKERGLALDTPLYLLCRAGARAQKAAVAFDAHGCQNVHVIEGGLLACHEMGIACSQNRKIISLERQVRIAAGLLVLTGAVLGNIVDPYWHALSAGIGGGLVFAGVTNACGLALLLARMPWNRAS